MTIKAEVVADSVADSGIRLTTLSLEYPRFIHAEFMTHRMFSRNASSSRAIPISKMNHNIANNYARPVQWGRNQAGMQAHTTLSPADEPVAQEIWKQACINALRSSDELSSIDVHKQIANRLTEPFQHIKVVVTATEWDNFFKLRLHPDAQPEIQELARVMKLAMDESVPTEVKYRYYHAPFISGGVCDDEEHIKASVARCARVSYMNHDGTMPDLAKDVALYERLLASGHMSPFEHVATPMTNWYLGVTHVDSYGHRWSNNFKGWSQYRALLS